MPNKHVEQAPERKLPAICSASHNYQQDVVEWACSTRHAVFLAHDLHSPSVNSTVTQQEGEPLVHVLVLASSCGRVQS